jgi:hypothetical protein
MTTLRDLLQLEARAAVDRIGSDQWLIQRAVGHRKYATTEGYVREASVFRGRVGDPFPGLPTSIVAANRSPNRSPSVEITTKHREKLSVPKGIRTPVTALKGPCPGPG